MLKFIYSAVKEIKKPWLQNDIVLIRVKCVRLILFIYSFEITVKVACKLLTNGVEVVKMDTL